MVSEKNSDKLDQVVARARLTAQQRDQGYRAQALKMYPWICGVVRGNSPAKPCRS